MNQLIKTRFTWLIIGFAAMGAILYGYDIGIISGAFLFIKHDIFMTDRQLSFIGGAVLGGGTLATLITGPLADYLGRRKMMMAAAIFTLVGVFMVAGAHAYATILMGRLVQGIGIGIVVIVMPLYITETIPSHYRGRGLAAFQLLLTGGILLGGLIGLYFTVHGGNWRAMFVTAAVPALIILLGNLVLDDSPRWLMSQQREARALKMLQKSRPLEEAKLELAEIKRALEETRDRQGNKTPLFQRRYIKPLLIVFAVAILNQLTGINSILQFSALILKASNMHSNLVDMLGASSIMALNFIATLIVLTVVDRVGRKTLLSIGTAGVALSLLISGLFLIFLPNGPLQGYIILAGMLGFIIFFAIGPGVMVWLVLSELLPSRIRSTGMAIALALNSFTSTLLAAFFVPLADKITYAGIFIICALCTLVYFVIAAFILPEARGKRLEEIEALFDT